MENFTEHYTGNRGFILPAAAGLLLLLIMGFTDEQRYSFVFLTDPGSLITLGSSFVALTLSIAVFYFLLLRRVRGFARHVLSFFLGIPLAIALLAVTVLFVLG